MKGRPSRVERGARAFMRTMSQAGLRSGVDSDCDLPLTASAYGRQAAGCWTGRNRAGDHHDWIPTMPVGTEQNEAPGQSKAIEIPLMHHRSFTKKFPIHGCRVLQGWTGSEVGPSSQPIVVGQRGWGFSR